MWTSEAEGAWGRDWAAPGAVSEAFKRLWPQAVRWTMAAPASPDLRVSVTRTGSTPQVRVESFTPEGTYRNLLQTVADVSLPDGSGQRIPLPQTGPGRYEGRFPLAGAGVYALQVTQTDEARAPRGRQTTGYALPHLPEYAVNPANRILLERLAAETGGPVLNRPQEAWRRDTRHALQPQDVWPKPWAWPWSSSSPTSPCAACARERRTCAPGRPPCAAWESASTPGAGPAPAPPCTPSRPGAGADPSPTSEVSGRTGGGPESPAGGLNRAVTSSASGHSRP